MFAVIAAHNPVDNMAQIWWREHDSQKRKGGDVIVRWLIVLMFTNNLKVCINFIMSSLGCTHTQTHKFV